MQPDAAGTVIRQEAGSVGVKAVAAKDGIIAINIKSSRMLLAYGFFRKIFEVFEKISHADRYDHYFRGCCICYYRY